MNETIAFQLDSELASALQRQGIDSLEEAVAQEEPRVDLVRQHAGGKGSKDAVAIISATAALAPFVVQIALRLIDRLAGCATYEEEVEELADGSKKRVVRITPC